MTKQLAFVGVGHIHTPGFIRMLGERSDVGVKSVWDHDAERAGRRAGELKAQVVPEVEAIWSDPTIEAVIICSETNLHEKLVLEAARAKKHMFVEKPLGISARDAYAMAAAIDAAGVLFQTGYFMRGNPVHRFLKAEIAAGHFGTVTRIRHTNCHSGSLGGWFDTEWRWMADPSIAGVGAYGDLGTHSLDILLWLMGDVERATADIRVVTGRYGDCDETGEGILQFANGAIGTLAAGWVDVAHPISVVVSGTEGHAYVLDGKLFYQSKHVEGADGKSEWTKLDTPWPHAFHLFLDALVGKPGVSLVRPQEAAARSAVMEALYKGAAEGTWVAPEKA
jgi:predicted dehydrogenase